MTEEDILLKRLLRVKKLERPSNEEWENFRRSFENRKMAAMGCRRSHCWSSRLLFIFKRMAILAVIPLFAVMVSPKTIKPSQRAEKLITENVGTRGSVQFASDTITCGVGEKMFVADICAMARSSDKTCYVQDSLSTVNFL